MQPGLFTFTLDRFTCHVLLDAQARLPSNHVFGPHPPLHASHTQSGDTLQDLTLSINVLLLEVDGHRLLVDTGLGTSHGRLRTELEQAGFARETIDLVFLTHGHADHIGGVVDASGNLAFPRARHLFPAEEWRLWTDPAWLSERDPRLQAAARQILPALAERVELVRPTEYILPGLRTIGLPGHTPGHMGLLVGQRLLHAADLLFHEAQVAVPEAPLLQDMDVDGAVETRRSILNQAARAGWLVHVAHVAFPGLLRISTGRHAPLAAELVR